MKDFDAKMRERYLQREDDRLQRKLEKRIRKGKEAFYSRTDKDEQAADAYQRLLNLAAELRGDNYG